MTQRIIIINFIIRKMRELLFAKRKIQIIFIKAEMRITMI